MSEQDYIALTTDIQQLITADQAWHYAILPKKSDNRQLELYIDETRYSDPVKEELEMLFGKEITFFKLNNEIVAKTLGKFYRRGSRKGNLSKASVYDQHSEDFLLHLISEANNIGSSDIHIEIYDEKCRVRMRIDGKLVERYMLKKEDYPSIINKIKIKASLDIAEKRLPQDGRIFFKTSDEKFDIRVSVLPTLYGEKIVLRLLSKDATNIEINSLGFEQFQLEEYLEGIKKPHGIILISGPTGSGKTTTLYATLKILNNEHSNILTIEDPIEYTLDGINQVQLKETIGLTFASALRTFLRQDPDIIMLGEIRDGETAQMAVRAALTGHLVLSTIHTNSAWGTISRLSDMGVPAYLLASTINLSVAQRLVRQLCPVCKEKKEFDPALFPKNYKPLDNIKFHYTAQGCEECYYTGYKSRKAVYEVIPIDYELSGHIKNKNFDVDAILKQKGIKRLSDTAFELFEKGETSMEEIYTMLM